MSKTFIVGQYHYDFLAYCEQAELSPNDPNVLFISNLRAMMGQTVRPDDTVVRLEREPIMTPNDRDWLEMYLEVRP